MIRHDKRVPTLFPRSDTVPFIPEPGGSHPSKHTLIDIFRRAIEYTGTQLQRPGPDGRGIHRFSEHVCRVSGAQFLTRLGYNIDAVQLIGRWGSDAIKRYIQDSPLMRPQQVTQISTEEHIRTLVKDQMTRSYNQFWIVHSTSGISHIPAIAENCIDNRRWHTICGWYYGSSTFKKSFNKPTKDRCLKCFRYTEIKGSTGNWPLRIRRRTLDYISGRRKRDEDRRIRVIIIHSSSNYVCQVGRLMTGKGQFIDRFLHSPWQIYILIFYQYAVFLNQSLLSSHPHSFATMHGPVPRTLDQILGEAGIPNDHKMALYLHHIGVRQPSQFALMFKDSDSRRLVPKVQEQSDIRWLRDTHHRWRQTHSHDRSGHRSIPGVQRRSRTTKTGDGTHTTHPTSITNSINTRLNTQSRRQGPKNVASRPIPNPHQTIPR